MPTQKVGEYFQQIEAAAYRHSGAQLWVPEDLEAFEPSLKDAHPKAPSIGCRSITHRAECGHRTYKKRVLIGPRFLYVTEKPRSARPAVNYGGDPVDSHVLRVLGDDHLAEELTPVRLYFANCWLPT
jgi:hypothetical protein